MILAYTGLIVLGFGGLALIAGQQISTAARDDYELQLVNEAILVSRGLEPVIREYQSQNITEDELNSILTDYETQTGSTLQLVLVTDSIDGPPPDQPDTTDDRTDSSFDRTDRDKDPRTDGEQNWPLPDDIKDYPEFIAASRNTITIDQRKNDNGTTMIYTAAPISDGRHFIGYVQLSEPASRLQNAITRRWGALGLGVAVIAVIALGASYWLSTSLIRPLGKLRDSALKLSQGDLSHRITDHSTDEVGEVSLAFNQMADRVEAMIEEQRAFASNTSHELRTPLTTMRLRTEALRYDPSLQDAERQQYINELDDELGRLSGLVEDLILLSRLDAGRTTLGTESIDLQRLAHNLEHSFASHAEAKDIALSFKVALGDSKQIAGGLNHLMILFRNLLDNAFKYTPTGGSVSVTFASDAANATISIQDTGQGIAPDDLPHLFERFYRADKARSRYVPGTGLGLSLAKSIVEAYGGTISVTSEGLDRGTTVTVRWPAPTTEG